MVESNNFNAAFMGRNLILKRLLRANRARLALELSILSVSLKLQAAFIVIPR